MVAVARARALRVRMELPVTVATRATVASAVVVSTVFQAPPRAIVAPRVGTPATVATVDSAVRLEPALVEPTVSTETAATPVPQETAATEHRVLRA